MTVELQDPPQSLDPSPPVADLIVAELGRDDPPEAAAVRGGLSGTLISVIIHLWLFSSLAGMTVNLGEQLASEPIQTRIDAAAVPEEPEAVIEYELTDPDDRDLEVREVLNAASVGQTQTNTPRAESAPAPPSEFVPLETRLVMYDVPEGIQVDDRLVVKGATGEALIEIESALDRVTWEIAQNLLERKVLVVWLLDASGSLIKQRQVLASRLERIYGELDALRTIGQIPQRDQPLLSGVVTFGQKTTFATPDPTDDFVVIRDAVENAPTDPSGVENPFTAISQLLDLWSKYRTRHGRQILIITVTDEASDDFGTHLELAIARCRHYGAKAYVIGPPAVFGRRAGFVSYVAPEDGKTYQLQVDLGPETPMIESVDLPFWYGGPQYTYLSAGFAPYALARIVNETGGVYFMTNMTTTQGLAPLGVFDSSVLAPYVPDYRYGSQSDYERDVSRFPLRAAVLTAGRLSRQNPPKGTPAMELRVTPENFKQVATEAQKSVAESQYVIDLILSAFPAGLDKEYAKEPSPRWRMAYCLAYGRLLAQRTRCLEYNYALAFLKNDLAADDVSRKSNRWLFRPDETIHYATSSRRDAKTATELLERVRDEAPGTPWAVLAARELKDPLGIRIIQQFVPPPAPRPSQPAALDKKPKQILFAPEAQKPAPPKPAPAKPQKPVLPKL